MDLDLVDGFRTRFLCQAVLLVPGMVLSNLVNNPFSHNIVDLVGEDQEGDQAEVVVEEDQEVGRKALMVFPPNLILRVQQVLDQG